MMLDFSRLINNFTDRIDINETINFDDAFIHNTDIRRLDNVKIIGSINKSENDIYHLHLSVSGIMVLPCALTLEDVDYPFAIEISEILTENCDTDEACLKIDGNSIDILPIIWQYIVLEIPSRVESYNSYKVNRSGEGWKLLTEEEKENKDTIDPRLEKLNDLLDD